jgi:hypothetical protein
MATAKSGSGLCKPGQVASKAPAKVKQSPHKKLASGAKNVVKGQK